MHKPEPQRAEQTRPEADVEANTYLNEACKDLPKYRQILNDASEVVFEYPSPS